MKPIDLDRLDALERTATPGPWAILPQEGPDGWPRLIAPIEPEADDDIEPDHYHVSDLDDCITDANGGLIVALRNAYPQLAAEIRALRAALLNLLAFDGRHGVYDAGQALGSDRAALRMIGIEAVKARQQEFVDRMLAGDAARGGS